MSDENITVANDVVVSMAFVLRIDDGQLIDQSEDDAPLEYIQGAGQIIPGLEKEIYGMNIGDEKDVQVNPGEGYGAHDPDEVVEIPRKNLSESLDLTVGKFLNVKDAESGEEFRAYIVKSNPETVTMDFNHPLAGRILNFHIKIMNLRQATEEELTHRHVHSENHTH